MFQSKILLVAFCLLSVACSAQLNFDYQKGKFLVKGKIVDSQTKSPIPLVNVRFNDSNKGYTCDNEGTFTFYVYKSDTLKFTSAGYLSKIIHISDLDSARYYTIEIQLYRDVIRLKEVIIYPFNSKEEFAKAFIEGENISRVTVPGIAPPKYSFITPRAKFTNPISYLYERVKKRSSANPDFRP